MVRPNLRVKIGTLELKNPVMAASGTFGSGEEFKGLFNLNSLGAIVTKSVTIRPKEGNRPPRIVETPSGMLNSIGLQNEGVDSFIEKKLPVLKGLKTAVIVSIAAESVEEYGELARRLDGQKRADALEINISCPNVKGGTEFSSEPNLTYEVVSTVRKNTRKALITKLSPNVKDIREIAKAAAEAGTDAVSLINTFLAMAIDIDYRCPILGNTVGGLSGPAIKPIALRMVWQVAKSVDIPVIGMGGIMDYEDALEFIIAGAGAVQIGTGNFVNPKASVEMVRGIEDYMRKNKIRTLKEIVGCLKA